MKVVVDLLEDLEFPCWGKAGFCTFLYRISNPVEFNRLPFEPKFIKRQSMFSEKCSNFLGKGKVRAAKPCKSCRFGKTTKFDSDIFSPRNFIDAFGDVWRRDKSFISV